MDSSGKHLQLHRPHMNNQKLLRPVAIALVMLGAAIASLLAFTFLIHTGFDEVILRLLGGFYFFLKENVSRISSNTDTWVPGIGAFFLALVISHRILRSFLSSRNQSWSIIQTICLGAFLPILFIIAFIVPGMLLQMKSLTGITWFEKSSNKTAWMRMTLRNIAQACHVSAVEHPNQSFPESLDAVDEDLVSTHLLRMPSTNPSLPVEPPIYLGAGFSQNSPGGRALLISPPFLKGQTYVRIVITRDVESIEIPAESAEVWIDEVLNERKATAPK